MATFSEMKKRAKEYLNPYINPSILEGINHINISTVKKMASVFLLIESLVLISYLTLFTEFIRRTDVIIMTVYSIVVSLVVYLVAKKALESTTKPYSAYKYLGLIYYFLMIIFAAFVSYYYYIQGDQMLIFFATIFSLVEFLIIPPYVSIIIIFSSYFAFFMLLLSYDGAARIIPFNYVMCAFITVAASIHKFHIQAKELERIRRIEIMNEMLQNVPVHDNLTDLKNRYALRDDFTSYQNHHIIVLMLDIDEFSRINETYGESVGDEILKEIGDLIKKHLTYSTSYRYGSDSFLIILQDLELGDALQRLSIWERSMASLTIPGQDEKIHYTSGYSHGTPRDEDDLRLLIEAADKKRRDFK